MTIFVLLLTALGLSMDAFAVSVSNAMCYPKMQRSQAIKASACFGLFQGIMPLLGFFAGRLIGDFMSRIDHWVALVLLGFIGGKMAWEGIQALRKPESCPNDAQYTGKTMLMQALATSIDALAVGISFAILDVNIVFAAALIALTTFVCCVVGSALGKRFGALLGDWAQIIGGLLLAGIGINIFIQHMFLA